METFSPDQLNAPITGSASVHQITDAAGQVTVTTAQTPNTLTK